MKCVTHVVRGKKMASKFKEKREQISILSKERMDICKQCQYLNDLKICKKCKCVMPLKVKLIQAKCPIGRW